MITMIYFFVGDYESLEAFRCGSYKSKEDIDLDEVEHKKILESILSSSNLRSKVLSDTLELNVVTKVNLHFHVIMSSSGDGNVSDATLKKQLEVLNEDFKKSLFQFEVKSIDRTANDKWYIMELDPKDESNESNAKNALRKGTAADLNIYLVGYEIKEGAIIRGGWATFPKEYKEKPKYDGVVVLSATLPGPLTYCIHVDVLYADDICCVDLYVASHRVHGCI